MRAEELRSLWQPKVAMVHSGTHLTEHPCGPYQPPRYRRRPNRPPRRQKVHRQLPAWRLRIWGHSQARSRVTLRRRLEARPRFQPYRRSIRRQTCRRRTTGNRISQSSPPHPLQRRNPPPVRPLRNPSLPHLRETSAATSPAVATSRPHTGPVPAPPIATGPTRDPEATPAIASQPLPTESQPPADTVTPLSPQVSGMPPTKSLTPLEHGTSSNYAITDADTADRRRRHPDGDQACGFTVGGSTASYLDTSDRACGGKTKAAATAPAHSIH
jgi:hypothetical protein